MRSALVLLCLLFPGCDGGGGDARDAAGDAGADAPGDGGSVPDGTGGPVLGSVRLAEAAVLGPYPWEGARAEARFTTSGLPDWHSDVLREGACRLRRYQPGSCDACDGICVAPAECRPYPTFLSAGAVSLTKMRGPVVLRDGGDGSYVLDNQPPADLFDAGAAVRASAPGGDFAAFSVEATGVAPLAANLAVDGQGILTLPAAGGFTFTWEAGGGDARVRLLLNAQTQGHGLPAVAVIDCEGPDSGSLAVPAAILEAFPQTQTSPICVGVDCPPSVIARVSRGAALAGASGGTVELLVESHTEFWIRHEP